MTGSVFTFPFLKTSPKAPPRPVLPIVVVNPETKLSQKVWGLIDTGADHCALPGWMSRSLGHNLELGDKSHIATGNGDSRAFSHTTQINVLEVAYNPCAPCVFGAGEDKVIFSTGIIKVDFMEGLCTPLLGTRNFLSHFLLTIDYKKEFFSLTLTT